MIQGPVDLASAGCYTGGWRARGPDWVGQGLGPGAVGVVVEGQAGGVDGNVPWLRGGNVVCVDLRWRVWRTVGGKDLDGLADVEGVEEGTVVNGDGVVGTGCGLDCSAEGILDGVLAGGNVDGGHAGVCVWGSVSRVSIIYRDAGGGGPGGDTDGEVKGFRRHDVVGECVAEGVVGLASYCNLGAVA